MIDKAHIEMIRQKIDLISVIVRKNPLVGIIPLLLITIDSVINYNPMLLYEKLLINQSLMMVCKKILSAILAIAAISFVFAVILTIILKVFANFDNSNKINLKDCSFLVFILAFLCYFQ
jgi:hypothetical protein